MPCYTLQLMSVEFHAEHGDVLQDALDALGMKYHVRQDGKLDVNYGSIVIDLEKHQAEFYGSAEQDRLNRIKRQYSKEALKKVSKMNMWQNQMQGGSANTVKGRLVKF